MRAGDKILCRKSYDYLFIKGRTYIISEIKPAWWDPVNFKEIEVEGYYSTGDKFNFPFIFPDQPNVLQSPRHNQFTKYFYLPQEQRKLKLKKLNKKTLLEKIRKLWLRETHT